MTPLSESPQSETSLWSRLLAWSQAIDDALDYDPVERSIDHLSRKVTFLEDRIRKLESRPRS